MASKRYKNSRKNLLPRVQGRKAHRENLQNAGYLLRQRAIEDFKTCHNQLVGVPSGTITFQIRISSKPSQWFYRSIESTGFSATRIHGTNLKVTACIGPHWTKEASKREDWENEICIFEKAEAREKLVTLGAKILPPIAPAEKTWRLHAIMKLGSTFGYTPIPIILYRADLGSHSAISSESAQDATDSLVQKIRNLSLRRLHGATLT